MAQGEREAVSNPHRYGQKLGNFSLTAIPRRGVSNPHRYGQKCQYPLFICEATITFQTLIGTVKSLLAHLAYDTQKL